MLSERIVRWDPFAQEPPGLGPCVVAIGIFDGMHLGHRGLLMEARARALALGAALVVVTFERDPDELFRAGDASFGKLLSNERRLRMLPKVSGGVVLALPADERVFHMEPASFLDALGRACEPVAVYVGRDFRFGYQGSGTVADIERWGASLGCECVPHALIEQEHAPVTATRIRALLREGEVAQARALLAGRPHSIVGEVVHGRGEGTGFGFATANLDLSRCPVMTPREGVYGGYALVGGERYATAVNMGVAKSFAAATAPLEAHLLGFEGDLYGKTVEIEFVQWLREMRVFDSQDELVETVGHDIGWVRDNLSTGCHGADR